MMKILTLTTTFNRSDITVRGIKSLLEAQKNTPNILYKNIVVDDNSHDGTRSNLEMFFLDEVTVISTPGDLYWAGGMRFGFDYIANELSGEGYDLIFCYNDDVSFYKDAFSIFIRDMSNNNLLVGAIKDPATDNISYGGRLKKSIFFPYGTFMKSPDGACLEVDTANFNAIMIPKNIIESVGFLADYFIHSQADIEFGMRVTKSGAQIFQTREFVGDCSLNSLNNTSRDNSLSLFKRIKALYGIKEQPFYQCYRFHRDYHRLWFVFLFIPVLKILISWIRR